MRRLVWITLRRPVAIIVGIVGALAPTAFPVRTGGAPAGV